VLAVAMGTARLLMAQQVATRVAVAGVMMSGVEAQQVEEAAAEPMMTSA